VGLCFVFIFRANVIVNILPEANKEMRLAQAPCAFPVGAGLLAMVFHDDGALFDVVGVLAGAIAGKPTPAGASSVRKIGRPG
jgi:hypothetical protein